MINARPNALSLVVVVAISSAITTQALADRRLQTKSFDIHGNKPVEFTRGEVMVQPTLGDDQQPIPKSFTTTYPDRTQVRADYDIPSEGFTDILSGIEGGVSSVDLFETNDNDIARKYTKILKVGNEGIFRFTHNLAEKKLVIEVRDGMTDQDSVEAIRNQSDDIPLLDTLTKIASPEQLARLLKGANERAGNLGEVDNYVALATVAVDEVEVNGRTFMRLVAAGDEPPELQRLEQSLFINDEALLAAATSAYTQVHVLKDDLQQEALNELLSYQKPVGYVVHVEDETQVYPLPAGYPKLEVDQVSGEIIVFRGQKQNPSDIAFVESHYDLWNKFKDQSTQVKKDKVKSYQYVIRNRQMELLEEFAADLAAQNDAELNEDKLSKLTYYESLQQALASATPDETDEFEFTTRHIRDASSVIKPIWVQCQLIKNFSFKPVLKNLLTHHNFVQNFLLYQHEDSRTDAEIKARYATIAMHLNIQDFDSNTNVDAQQEHLLQTFKTMKAWEEGLRQQLKAMSYQLDIEDVYTQLRKDTLAVVLGIDPAKDTRLEDRASMESKVIDKLSELSKLKIELEDIKTPGHPKLMPEVLETIRRVLIALEGGRYFKQKQSVYVLRQFISIGINHDIREARKQSEEKAHSMLDRVERLLNIEINEGDYKTARLERILTKLDAGDISKDELDGMHETICREDCPDWEDLEGNSSEMDIKRMTVRDRLNYIIEESDQRAREQQASRLIVLENELDIDPHENPHTIERGKSFTAKLASDLEVEFEDDASLSVRQYALSNRIEELWNRVEELYEDESARRICNNKIAHQLNIKDYEDDARIDDQDCLIAAKLQQLDDEILKAGQPDVNERIAAIDDELERQIARLGPKPRHVLDREAATARFLIARAESELAGFHRRLNRLRSSEDYTNAHGRDESHEVEGELLLTRKKYTQATGGGDGTDGKIRHLVQEQAYLEDEIEIKKADIERLKEVLKAAERAVKHDGGPFQYSPQQAKVRTDMDAFVKQNSLRKQALETAMGLAELAAENGKTISYLPIFDFDDEFAPNHLQAMVGDKLTLKQASRIVEVFKSLKTTFPESSVEPVEALLGNDLKEIFRLVRKARHGMKKGARQYDDEIRSMSKTAVHFIQHQSEDLKSFPEYFATHSAIGNKIISLLREGLISKVELENYIKAVRGAEGYQTVDEFEHFLGYEHGVRLPEFRKVVQTLSDKGADEFMQSVFTPVPVTASGPAAMKESVAGMKEYAAAVIANYFLDDIAFDNGRRTAAFLTNIQDTLTPYANAAGLSESELIKAIHGTLMQAHAAAVEQQLNDYWGKPSAFLVQAVTWYFSSYKPLLVTHTTLQAAEQSLLNMSFLYLLDLTNRGDYLHRMLIPFQHWLEGFGVDPDRTGQYAYHSGIEKVSEVGGLAMPLGKAASSVILLRTGAMLFARQHNANPQMYRSISRLLPELVKSMVSGQGVQVPLLHRATPQKLKTLTSATASLMLGPVATVGAYAYGLISGFTYAQTFGFALASSLAFDFFMNDNKMLTQWLGGPLGRSLDKINRWTGVGETTDNYVKRTTIARPQRFDETDAAYASHVKANNTLYGWTRHENYLQFRERRDRTMKLFENGWEKYFRENLPGWSFSHAESIPYFYTLGAFYRWQKGDDQKVHGHDKSNAPQSGSLSATMTH
ncbi:MULTISPECIES: hypothetical protein [unclassified Endozoicomonas]|uniref:hypothetical protein n=1 Tax=unclassified Endozoicomonas TaxID=2644528 RepID=UPI003BB7B3B9